MLEKDIKTLLESRFEDGIIEVTSDGSHFNLLIVSDEFSGMMPVKKQQLVYSVINEKIADGSMHAVNMKLMTKSQWDQQAN